VISLAVLLVPVFVLVGGYQLISGRNEPVEVDTAPALAEAEAAGMAVAAPAGLADGWVPVSAVFQRPAGGLTLRIGYITPDGPSVQLVQSTVPAERLLPSELPDGAQPAGTVDVAGEPWQPYQNQDGERALVHLAPDLTTMVVGATSEAQLRDLAASLAPPR
jgi:Protein of unknown function (DUF4245)